MNAAATKTIGGPWPDRSNASRVPSREVTVSIGIPLSKNAYVLPTNAPGADGHTPGSNSGRDYVRVDVLVVALVYPGRRLT